MHHPVGTVFDATISELPLGPAEPHAAVVSDPGLGRVNAVDATGKAVGRSMALPLLGHASAWANGVLTDLQAQVGEFTNETTKDHSIIFSSEAHAISPHGSVVGFVETTSTGLFPPFRQKVIADMATLNMTAIFPGQALGINSSGQIVGFSFTRMAIHSNSINPIGQHAVLWDNFKLTNLLGAPHDSDHSLANAINDHGQIVGEAFTARGFSFHNGNVTILDGTRPRAINNAGQVVGASFASGSLGLPQAFLWQGGPVTPLPFLPGSGISDAFGINNAGQIVGYSRDGDSVTNRGTFRAVIWTKGVIQDLTSMLPPNSGWTLGIAKGISDAGHIVGLGVHNGEHKGFLLTLPQLVLDPGAPAVL